MLFELFQRYRDYETVGIVARNGIGFIVDIYGNRNHVSLCGNEIYLADIFKEGYEEYLCNRLTDALADKIGATSRKDIKEKGYLTFNDIYPTENFMMKKDSILFFYNAYDIAPYCMGTTTLGFTYDELSEIMK